VTCSQAGIGHAQRISRVRSPGSRSPEDLLDLPRGSPGSEDLPGQAGLLVISVRLLRDGGGLGADAPSSDAELALDGRDVLPDPGPLLEPAGEPPREVRHALGAGNAEDGGQLGERRLGVFPYQEGRAGVGPARTEESGQPGEPLFTEAPENAPLPCRFFCRMTVILGQDGVYSLRVRCAPAVFGNLVGSRGNHETGEKHKRGRERCHEG
jgi:hypothetical protein